MKYFIKSILIVVFLVALILKPNITVAQRFKPTDYPLHRSVRADAKLNLGKIDKTRFLITILIIGSVIGGIFWLTKVGKIESEKIIEEKNPLIEE
jgi:hypothetical protein